MLRTMRILLLAGVLGGLAATPALAQSGRMGGGGHGFGGGGSHGFSAGGGGSFYPHMGGSGNMGGPGHMSMRGGGPYQSYGGQSYGGRAYGGGRQFARMHAGNDFNRMGDRRMRALAPANAGDFRRDRFRGDHGRFDRFDRRHARFDDGNHQRFRHRHGNFVFFNSGWWYDEPWWNYDTTAYYDSGYGGDEHAQWCADRYRSYNPGDNTFMGYGGEIQECVSPFGP